MKALLLLVAALVLTGAQEESQAERLWRLATTGKAVIRPQAAERLRQLGDPGRDLALERTAAGTAALAASGPALVKVLSGFDDPTLRARVIDALDDPEFPWRPEAARGLAEAPLPQELERWIARSEDPIAPVRAAAVRALGALDARDELPRLRRLLNDPDSRVRCPAAVVLDRWGDREALWWLAHELEREDHFFGMPVGVMAGGEASKVIALELGVGPKDFDRWLLENRGERPDLPQMLQAGKPDLGEVLGIEVRSCRRGEYDLRFTASDELWVGRDLLRRFQLAEGTVTALLEAFEEVFENLEPGLYGKPGCDGETFHLRPAAEGRSTMRLFSKPYDAREARRPAALDGLARAMVAALPDRELAAEVAAALAAVGGALE